MIEKRNAYGFPVMALEVAQEKAAEVRARQAEAPCACKECEVARNLPGVQRILAKWTPMDRLVP